MQSDKHIFLTGFMGCGKTTAGKKLAKLLRRNFVDLDGYIEQKEKITIQSIFENFGEEIFRKIEQTCLNQILLKEKNAVISLGGGTICYQNNLEIIKKSGLVIYVELPVITLVQRLEKSKTKRPLLKNLKNEELVYFVTDKLNERISFYNKAHIKVSGLNLAPQTLQQAISEFEN